MSVSQTNSESFIYRRADLLRHFLPAHISLSSYSLHDIFLGGLFLLARAFTHDLASLHPAYAPGSPVWEIFASGWGYHPRFGCPSPQSSLSAHLSGGFSPPAGAFTHVLASLPPAHASGSPLWGILASGWGFHPRFGLTSSSLRSQLTCLGGFSPPAGAFTHVLAVLPPVFALNSPVWGDSRLRLGLSPTIWPHFPQFAHPRGFSRLPRGFCARFFIFCATPVSPAVPPCAFSRRSAPAKKLPENPRQLFISTKLFLPCAIAQTMFHAIA